MDDKDFDSMHGALLLDMSALVELLRCAGEERWAAWIEGDRALVAKGERSGIQHFLSAFGGMGSLNDLFLRSLNGVALSSKDAAQATAKFDELKGRAWTLADRLRRELDRS